MLCIRSVRREIVTSTLSVSHIVKPRSVIGASRPLCAVARLLIVPVQDAAAGPEGYAVLLGYVLYQAAEVADAVGRAVMYGCMEMAKTRALSAPSASITSRTSLVRLKSSGAEWC